MGDRIGGARRRGRHDHAGDAAERQSADDDRRGVRRQAGGGNRRQPRRLRPVGGIVPGNLDQLPGWRSAGCAGSRHSCPNTGVPDFVRSDELTLYEAMSLIAGLPAAPLVAVHAESETITRELAAAGARRGPGRGPRLPGLAPGRRRDRGDRDARSSWRTRPAVGCTSCTCRRAAASRWSPRPALRGIDVSCEVTAHHLLLTEEDAERLGAIAKCAPPLRPAAECEALWSGLRDGNVSFVVSDHSPSVPELREGDAFSSWGGIPGCQSTLELLLTEGRLTLPELAERVAGAVAAAVLAARQGIARARQRRRPGARPAGRSSPAGRRRAALPPSHEPVRRPGAGRPRVVRTIVRGETVYADGELVGEPLRAPGHAGSGGWVNLIGLPNGSRAAQSVP